MSDFYLGDEFDSGDMAILRAMMSGDDDEYEISGGPYEIGAARRRPRALMQTQPAPIPMQRPAMRVRTKKPENARVFPIGLKSSSAVSAGATVTVQSQPQDLFKARKFVVPASVAPDFLINDIKVGNQSQFSSSDPIHAESFTQGAVDCQVEFDTSAISQIVSVNVTNISGADAFFYATMFGYVARY